MGKNSHTYIMITVQFLLYVLLMHCHSECVNQRYQELQVSHPSLEKEGFHLCQLSGYGQ